MQSNLSNEIALHYSSFSTIMKTYILILSIVSIAACTLFSCSDNGNDIPNPDIRPSIAHTYQIASRNGQLIAYRWGNPDKAPFTGIRVLNLGTGNQQDVDIRNILPTNMKLLDIAMVTSWCPYNNDEILLYATTATDTIGDGKQYGYGHNLIIYSLSSHTIEIVTPDIFGLVNKSGDFGEWFYGSFPEADSFLVTSTYEVYVPQTKTYSPFPYHYIGKQSPNGQFYVGAGELNSSTLLFSNLRVNNRIFTLPSPVKSLNDVNWSPDSKKVILKFETPSYQQVHVIADIARAMHENLSVLPIEVVPIPIPNANIIYASFLTDSTLVASLQIDPDDPIYLWEMTTKGTIVRQLTFAP